MGIKMNNEVKPVWHLETIRDVLKLIGEGLALVEGARTILRTVKMLAEQNKNFAKSTLMKILKSRISQRIIHTLFLMFWCRRVFKSLRRIDALKKECA
eukprot:GHVP01041505.1.p1 GENE.GHVP01041505.1~~GHVP01041505.1.p1  ORF type:complete len:105 (+),score=9.81 GHVP01041505.1:24-317(+)